MQSALVGAASAPGRTTSGLHVDLRQGAHTSICTTHGDRLWWRTFALMWQIALAAAITAGASAQTSAERTKEPTIDYWQPLWMQRELWGPGTMPPGMRARLLRHHTYVHYGVQKEYQGAKSTVASTKQVLEEGAEIYSQNCARCHGKQGLGDGEARRSLLPSPALLAFMIQRPIAVDEYLLWSIAEGGNQFDTDMPAFKDTLKREDIWKVIAYMRAGFPEHATATPGK
jgi:mono/diheme cytochrome c family protein